MWNVKPTYNPGEYTQTVLHCEKMSKVKVKLR